MATQFPAITKKHEALIDSAPLFFVGTADPGMAKGPHDVGAINLSPKGGTPLHVITPTQVAYLDYPGSGNETARHLALGSPITVLVCSFDGTDAGILRLYGTGRVCPLDDSPLAQRVLSAPAAELKGKGRQAIVIDVEMAQISCGYGVPVMDFLRERRSADRGRGYKGPRVPKKESSDQPI